MLFIRPVQCQGGLGIFDGIVGKIAHETAGEGRKSGYLRGLVLRDDLPDILCGIRVRDRQGRTRVNRDSAVLAGKFKAGIISQKSIPSPFGRILKAFQNKTMPADGLHRPEHLDRCPAV